VRLVHEPTGDVARSVLAVPSHAPSLAEIVEARRARMTALARLAGR